MNPYKMLWSVIGGRPWTYITRDLWHKAEILWIIGLIAVGVWMGHNLNWLEDLRWMGVFVGGFIFGHFFWGRKYIAGQRGQPDDSSSDSESSHATQ